jgi:hypothetical protein
MTGVEERRTAKCRKRLPGLSEMHFRFRCYRTPKQAAATGGAASWRSSRGADMLDPVGFGDENP